jgi:lysophospholipase L1-like esterase
MRSRIVLLVAMMLGMASQAVAFPITAPTDIAGLQLWLDANYTFTDGGGATPCTDGDAVGSYLNRATAGVVDATATSSGNRPRYTAAAFNGLPGIRFTKTSSQTLIGPNIAFNLRDFSVGMMALPVFDDVAGASNLSALFQLGSDDLNVFNDGDETGLSIYTPGTSVVALNNPRNYTPTPYVFRGSASALKVRQHSYESSRAVLAAVTGSGVKIGALGTSYYYNGMFQHVLVYSRALTDQETSDLAAWMMTQAGLRLRGGDRSAIVHSGDSISVGTQSAGSLTTTVTSVQNQLAQLLTGYDFVCTAISGQRADQIASRYATRCGRFATSTGTNVAIILAGTNDVVGGATAQQIHDRLVDCANAARLAGADFVIVNTILPPHGNIVANTVRLATNVLIRANTTDWDAVADIGGDAVMGVYQAVGTDNPGFVDDLHPNAYGSGIIANINKAALLTLIPSSTGGGFSGGGKASPFNLGPFFSTMKESNEELPFDALLGGRHLHGDALGGIRPVFRGLQQGATVHLPGRRPDRDRDPITGRRHSADYRHESHRGMGLLQGL